MDMFLDMPGLVFVTCSFDIFFHDVSNVNCGGDFWANLHRNNSAPPDKQL